MNKEGKDNKNNDLSDFIHLNDQNENEIQLKVLDSNPGISNEMIEQHTNCTCGAGQTCDLCRGHKK
jgi:hypothetical protein